MARLAGKAGDVYVADRLIDDGEAAWTTAGAGRVSSLDNSDYKVGSGSAKMVTTNIGATTLLDTKAISSVDLTAYLAILAWVKSSINQSAGDHQLLLDDTASCASPLESLDIPALVANTWKMCKMTLVTPANLGAVISVGRKQITDLADGSFWIDEIRAARRIAGVKGWSIDQVMEVIDATGFDNSGVRAYLPTLSGWKGSFEGYKDGAPITIGTITHLELRESATATQQFRGSVIITGLHAKGSWDGLNMYSYDFQGIHGLELPTA